MDPYRKPVQPNGSALPYGRALPQAIDMAAFPLGFCAATTVEILVPDATTRSKFPFEINETLRNRHLLAVEVSQQLNSNRSPKYQASITTRAQIDNSFVTLSLGSGYQQFENVPLVSLLRAANNGRMFPINAINIDWQDSFVQYTGASPATGFANGPFAYVFTFYHLGDPNAPVGAA